MEVGWFGKARKLAVKTGAKLLAYPINPTSLCVKERRVTLTRFVIYVKYNSTYEFKPEVEHPGFLDVWIILDVVFCIQGISLDDYSACPVFPVFVCQRQY